MVAGFIMGVVGLLVVIVSTFGMADNYEELGVHFCSNPQPNPVCGSILRLIVELALIASIGVAMVVVGLYLASREEKSPRTS
jgi:hypothetical protein